MATYPPPNDRWLPIFDVLSFRPATSAAAGGGGGGGGDYLTQAEADRLYLQYPIAQGNITLTSVQIDNAAQFAARANFNSALHAYQGVTYANGTVQTTASNALVPSTTYQNTTVTTDAYGAIVSLANGSGASPANMVTTDSAQAITGQKTFTQTILGTCSNATLAASATTVATTTLAGAAPMYLTAGNLGPTAGNSTLQSCTNATLTPNGTLTVYGLTANAGTITAGNASRLVFYNSNNTVGVQFQQTLFGGTNAFTILADSGSPSGSLFYLRQSAGTIPAPQPTASYTVGGTIISWNNVTEFLNMSGTSTAGGFSFSASSSTQTTALIAKLVRGTFAPNDASNQLATNAWSQTAISAAISAIPPAPAAAVTKVSYYQNLVAGTGAWTIINAITISGLSTANFYGATSNNYFAVRYTYTSFTADLATIVSSTGELMFFPSRITGAPLAVGNTTYFGTVANNQSYNVNNSINGITAFNAGFNSYTPWNRQYWCSAPAQGQNSGYVGAPNSMYLTGSATSSVSNYGFNLFAPAAGGGAWGYSLTLEFMSNAYLTSCPVTFLPSYSY